MRFPDIGDESAIGLHDFAQLRDFARVIGASFDHGEIVFGAQTEQREGHTDMIVEVAFGVEHLEFLAEHRGNEFFGGGFAVGAGDLQHRGVEHTAVVGRQFLQYGKYVVDKKATRIFYSHFGIVHHSVGATVGQGVECKGVAVELVAAQREEKTALGTVARVGRHHGMTMVDIIELGKCHNSVLGSCLQKYIFLANEPKKSLVYFAIHASPLNFASIRRRILLQIMTHTLRINDHLFPLDRPLVMGILNATPDSFFADSRTPVSDVEALRRRVRTLVDEGADCIDVGAYSTRPGADEVSADEEMRRLAAALEVVREEAPDTLLSVDTFRAEVALHCVRDYGVQLINDISGGTLDRAMFHTVARLGVPYVLMHLQGTPRTMQCNPQYDDVVADVIEWLARRVQRLRELGAHDIILDPGFGFGKTMEHNYALLDKLDYFHELGLPLLVGVSRKSMIYKLLGTDAAQALNGTTVVNTIALLKGAHILRVHDVRAAVEAVRIVEKMRAADTK